MKRVFREVRRLKRLEDRPGDGTKTGVEEVEAAELDDWWEQWDGTPSPLDGLGPMVIPRELTMAEWEQQYGSPIAVKTKEEESN